MLKCLIYFSLFELVVIFVLFLVKKLLIRNFCNKNAALEFRAETYTFMHVTTTYKRT